MRPAFFVSVASFCVAFCLGLTACAVQPVAGPVAIGKVTGVAASAASSSPGVNESASTPSALGDTTASSLRQRYADTRTNCGSSTKPSALCSGILLRGTTYSPAYHSWNPNPASGKPGGVSFSWFRHDAQYGKLAYGYAHGFTVYAPDATPSGRKRMVMLCAFPIDGDTDVRSEAGCGAHREFADSGPCNRQNISTVDAWLAHYRSDEGVSYPQGHTCGFTTGASDSAAARNFALLPPIMAALGDESFQEQNEVILQECEQNAHSTVPLESLFYISGSVGGLDDARSEQLDFYRTALRWVPIIRITLPRRVDDVAAFDYIASEQAVAEDHASEGASVASHLTVRYGETSTDCSSSPEPNPQRPVFLCSGIMLRPTRYVAGQSSWKPDPSTNNSVSIRWLRQDANFRGLSSLVNGHIFLPAFFADDPGNEFASLEVLCALPLDGATAGRLGNGCGASTSYPAQSVPCQEQHIDTAQAWVDHRKANTAAAYQCAFAQAIGVPNTAPAFMAMIGAMTLLGSTSFSAYNELVLAAWPSDLAPERLPIECFFFLSGSSAGLANARKDQSDYLRATGLWRPIVRLTMAGSAGAKATFAYAASDQALP